MSPASLDNIRRSVAPEAASSQICKESVHSRSKYAYPNTASNDENAFLREELEHLPHRHVPVHAFLDAVMGHSIFNERLERAKKIVKTKRFRQCLEDYIKFLDSVDPTKSFERLVQHMLDPMGSYTGGIHYIRTADAPLTGSRSSADTERTPAGVLFRSIPNAGLQPPTWSHVLIPFEFRDPNSTRDPASAQSSIEPIHNDALHNVRCTEHNPLPTTSLGLSHIGHLNLDSKSGPPGPNTLKRPRADDDADDQSPVDKKRKGDGGNALVQSTFRQGPIGPGGRRTILTDRERLAGSALEVMSVFGDRRFVLGVFVDKAEIELWYFDRSGGVASAPFNLDTHPELFVAFAQGLLHATPEQLGYEPAILRPHHIDPKDPDTHHFHVGTDNADIILHGHRYTIGNTLSVPRGLRGRGTVVFGVKDDQAEYVAKLSWQLRCRVSERELMESHHVDGIPVIHDAADGGTLCDGPRGRLHEYLHGTENLDRILTIVIMSPICEPISKVQNNSEFKQAFISLVKCHRNLYVSSRLLHGDINVDNLMVRRDDHSQGILIDFHMAMPVDSTGVLTNGQYLDDRSGCLPFLPIDLLQNNPHPPLYRHDLESFFWCLIWLMNDNNNSGILNNWYEGSWLNIHQVKTGILNSYKGMENYPEHLMGMRSWLNKLVPLFSRAYRGLFKHERRILRGKTSYYDYSTLGGHITYDKFMAILES